ncbi:SGNH hydrolase domain-containing protein [Paraburkholderia guartelaensis]|uniref:SGNH hydrolase domain-containing protein n=1 Tax=Paraburkholderia guartelaensis TaxID=2546446 RepID=UPI002AB76CF4|nr:SGNH hydrolase domain-containing protein [Paraburkholderia guartelaensis]
MQYLTETGGILCNRHHLRGGIPVVFTWVSVRHIPGMSNLSAAQRCAISYRSDFDGTDAYRAIIDQVKQRHPDLMVYEPASVLCDAQRNICPMTMSGKYLYSYGDHMSDYANGLVTSQFLPLLAH